MERSGVVRKKLRRNRLELLKWRAALRGGFGSVAAMEEKLSRGELSKLLAVCWLDGAGEEWQRIAAELVNLSLRLMRAQGAEIRDDAWKSPHDMEMFKYLNPQGQTPEPEMNWDAAMAMGRSMAGL